ncbi:hypothetical protein F5Y10DRAFT_183803 [Nemania abortiva]|nr:hypothetical protein F5Y10DRAFT_183803 [Nemania abortiva]
MENDRDVAVRMNSHLSDVHINRLMEQGVPELCFDYGGELRTTRTEYKAQLARAEENNAYPRYVEIIDSMLADAFRPFTENAKTKGRPYHRNRLTGIDDALLIGQARTPSQYWKAVLTQYPIQEGFRPKEVIQHLARIQPNHQPSKSKVYSSVKAKLDAISANRAHNKYVPTGDYLNIPTGEEIEALRIFGSADHGFGTIPAVIESLLTKTGLAWLALPKARAKIPDYWYEYFKKQTEKTNFYKANVSTMNTLKIPTRISHTSTADQTPSKGRKRASTHDTVSSSDESDTSLLVLPVNRYNNPLPPSEDNSGSASHGTSQLKKEIIQEAMASHSGDQRDSSTNRRHSANRLPVRSEGSVHTDRMKIRQVERVLDKGTEPMWLREDVVFKSKDFVNIAWSHHYSKHTAIDHPQIPPHIQDELGGTMKAHMDETGEDGMAIVFRMYRKAATHVGTKGSELHIEGYANLPALLPDARSRKEAQMIMSLDETVVTQPKKPSIQEQLDTLLSHMTSLKEEMERISEGAQLDKVIGPGITDRKIHEAIRQQKEGFLITEALADGGHPPTKPDIFKQNRRTRRLLSDDELEVDNESSSTCSRVKRRCQSLRHHRPSLRHHSDDSDEGHNSSDSQDTIPTGRWAQRVPVSVQQRLQRELC